MTRRRRYLAPGIWREGDKLKAEARIGSWRDGNQGRDDHEWPLGTDLDEIKAWQDTARAALRLARKDGPRRGTLAADIPTFLAMLPEGKDRKDPIGQYRRESVPIMAHWAASPIGAMPRQSVTRADLITQMSRWRDAGHAINTCNKRLSRLRVFYDKLDTPDRPHPTDKIKFTKERELEPRDIPPRIVRLILDSLPDVGRAAKGKSRPAVSHTKIRLRVMAWSGIPPATLQRVTSRDLDLDHARVRLSFRLKGGGSAAAWIKVLPEAVAALRDFVAAGLLGLSWSNSSAGGSFKTAIERAKETAAREADAGDPTWAAELDNLPPRCHPYDLRHSFATTMYGITGDFRAVAEMLQHRSERTTRRYTKGAVSKRVAAAIALATDEYANVPTLPTPAAMRPRRAFRIVRSA